MNSLLTLCTRTNNDERKATGSVYSYNRHRRVSYSECNAVCVYFWADADATPRSKDGVRTR